MFDFESLNKMKAKELEDIIAMKKPQKPRFPYTSGNYLKVLAVGVIGIILFSNLYGVDRSITNFAILICFGLTIIGLIGAIYRYYSITHDWKNTVKHWKKHKQNLIHETEAKFDDYAHQLLTTGTIRTDDPYIKQTLGLVPKCPTCGSTDIVSVSGIRRDLAQTAFGLANPTARAQFKCNNCGYKW